LLPPPNEKVDVVAGAAVPLLPPPDENVDVVAGAAVPLSPPPNERVDVVDAVAGAAAAVPLSPPPNENVDGVAAPFIVAVPLSFPNGNVDGVAVPLLFPNENVDGVAVPFVVAVPLLSPDENVDDVVVVAALNPSPNDAAGGPAAPLFTNGNFGVDADEALGPSFFFRRGIVVAPPLSPAVPLLSPNENFDSNDAAAVLGPANAVLNPMLFSNDGLDVGLFPDGGFGAPNGDGGFAQRAFSGEWRRARFEDILMKACPVLYLSYW